MSSGRHEAVEVGNIDIQAFHRCDFEHMRRLMKNPDCRTVAVGATVSPALFQTTRVFSDRCLWCDSCITCVGSAELAARELSSPDSAQQSSSALGLGQQGRIGQGPSLPRAGSGVLWRGRWSS